MGESEYTGLGAFFSNIAPAIGQEIDRPAQEKKQTDKDLRNAMAELYMNKAKKGLLAKETISPTGETVLEPLTIDDTYDVFKNIYGTGELSQGVKIMPDIPEDRGIYFADPNSKMIYSAGGQEYTGTVPKKSRIITVPKKDKVSTPRKANYKININNARKIATNLAKNKLLEDIKRKGGKKFFGGRRDLTPSEITARRKELKDIVIDEKDIDIYLPAAIKQSQGDIAGYKAELAKLESGYAIGDIVKRGGITYEVTGFDSDGEPLVREAK